MDKPKTEVVWKQVGSDSYVLLSLGTGQYFSLNESAMMVWLLLQSGCSDAEVVTKLAQQYNVAGSAVSIDVDVLIADFTANGLLTEEAGDTGQTQNLDKMSCSNSDYVRPELQIHDPIQTLTAGSGGGSSGGGYTYYYYYYYYY
jgi:hypothetical protein